MIECIVRKIKNASKAMDTVSIWIFFIAATVAIIKGVIELAYCVPSIPLIIVTSIIGLVILAHGFVRCFGKSDKIEG